MKTILKIEELAMFTLAFLFFQTLDLAWWWFWALLLTPDIGMLGYLVNNRIGALCYNLFHHKGVAILVGVWGYWGQFELGLIVGAILFAHSSFDRIFGYGLKYSQGFKFTHLGEIGHKNK